MSKITVKSPANIAFVKHWGMSPEGLPLGPSLSMNLSECFTTTTVEFAVEDSVEIEGLKLNLEDENSRDYQILLQLNRIRNLAKSDKKVSIKSKNSFPSRAGIASSASGFSALTMALCGLFELRGPLESMQSMAELVAQMGSISAVRSLGNDFCIVRDNIQLEEVSDNFAKFNLIDLILVINPEAKHVSSAEAQSLTYSSSLFNSRVDSAFSDLAKMLEAPDFATVGALIENQALMLHMVTMTAKPPVNYLSLQSLAAISRVWELRSDGVECYFTVDAGENVHVICQEKDLKEVQFDLEQLEYVKQIIVNRSCKGASFI